MKRVSEQIADWLVSQGIEQVFCVTGGGSMFLNQALGGHPNLRCTFMHHEQACAMAAEGYARITNKPAVVMVTTGPGSINALNGVYGAYTDSIPMLVLSGQVKRETCLSFYDLPKLRQLGDQEGPTIEMASPICKYARVVRTPQDLVTMLPEAFQAAVSGRPGPAWLDIPLDIQQSTDVLSIEPLAMKTSIQTSKLRSQCRQVIERLLTSDRPLVLGGTGIRIAGASERLIKLIERMKVPLATAWTHDLIESNHPLFAGRPGTIGTRSGNFCLQNSDFILVLGSRLNIRQTSYNWDSFAINAWVAQVDVDAAELQKPTIKTDLGIEADLNNFLDLFEEELTKVALPRFTAWIHWCQKIGVTYKVLNEHKQVSGGALNPYLVVDRIFRSLRADDIVVCGNASACILPFQIGHLKSGQRLFSNSGSASMGHDLPAAIGAASSQGSERKRRVICFAGDGSLQMNIQEFQTLKTMDLNIIVVVLNNSGYLSIWQTHENFFGKVIGATPASGVEFPDYKAVAAAYGLKSERVQSESNLTNLDSWLKLDGPLVIDVHVDPKQEFAPRIKSRVDEKGNFVTPQLDDMHPFLDSEVISKVRLDALRIKAEKA